VRRRAPQISRRKWVTRDLQDLQVPTNMHDLQGVCELRGLWRCKLYKLTTRMQLVCLSGGPAPPSSATATTCGSVPRCCSSPSGVTPPGLCSLSLLGVFLLLSALSGLEAVTGPGSRDPRSLDWSGGALAGTVPATQWVDLLLHAQ
jgi:hypothetical protein